jgi:hypothetical protein
MSVAAHLGIDLKEYDSRIRTFIPHYEEMLDVAAAAIPPRARTITDLGTGTGALSARCLKTAARARAIGIDLDRESCPLPANSRSAAAARHPRHRRLSAGTRCESQAGTVCRLAGSLAAQLYHA